MPQQNYSAMMIGREQEKDTLLSLLDKDESQFCAVYGRRRVGKTYLIRESFGYNFSFYHTGIANANKKRQLTGFRDSLQLLSGVRHPVPQNWYDAFGMLQNYLSAQKEGKKVIFLDELSWIDTPKSEFVSALEHFWNGWVSARKEKDIVLIVCASSASWIINKLLKNRGGLHNRLTEYILVKPFTLRECEQFAAASNLGMSRKDIVEAFMVLGGIPFYWSLLKKEYSLAQNIDALFFDANGKLTYEFDELYRSLFKNPQPYINIVKELGRKKCGITRAELLQALNLKSSSTITDLLSDLERSGFIRSYRAIGKCKKETIYQLIDNYTLFYFYFFYKNKERNNWIGNLLSPSYNTWVGLAFERVCLWHTEQIKRALNIAGIASNICSWYYKQAKSGVNDCKRGCQIDMLIDRVDNVINICEMKYSVGNYTINADTETNLRNKLSVFLEQTNTPKSVNIVLITTYGLNKNNYSNIVSNVLTMDDLFA